MRRRTWIALATGTLALLLSVTAIAAQHTYKGLPVVNLIVNGRTVESDVPAVILDNRTVLPVRAVAEALGLRVNWDAETYTVTLTRPDGAEAQDATASRPVGVPEDALPAVIERVVDGDTVEVDYYGLTVDVRLIGVDTPEVFGGTEPYGPEASAHTKAQLPPGTRVWLERGADERDRYGRLLAYVWTLDGALFNQKLLAGGFGEVLIIGNNTRYEERFRQAQARAQAEGMGMWGIEDSPTEEGATASADEGTDTYQEPYDPQGPDRDCGDFKTQAEAQAFFEAAGGPAQDPHRLDSNSDGVACESLS